MIRLTTRGAPRERGIQQGAACKELALPFLQRSKNKTAARQHADLDRTVEVFRRDLQTIVPDSYAEYRGIAEGLGMDESEYLRALVGEMVSWEVNCTTIGYNDDKGHPLLGKTDDIPKEDLGMNVLEIALPDRGCRQAIFHFAGTCWTTAGMNEAGLAIAMTGIPGPTVPAPGLFSLDAISSILPRCASVAEALDWVEGLPIKSYGFSLLLADAGGAMALIEKTALAMINMPLRSDGTFIHTNFIIDGAFSEKNPAQRETIDTNARLRFGNAANLVSLLPRRIEAMSDSLTDRNPSGAIRQCGEDGLYTDYACILAPREGRLMFWSGYPEWKQDTLCLRDIFGARDRNYLEGGATC